MKLSKPRARAGFQAVKRSDEKPIVSIIIPTFNSEDTIRGCLQSIKDQTYPNIEVIIVDRYSVDETVKIAENFKEKILLKNSERSAARNYGAAKANGSFVLFIDSDMELTPGVVEECVAACLSRGTEAAIIQEEPVVEGFLSEFRKIEK